MPDKVNKSINTLAHTTQAELPPKISPKKYIRKSLYKPTGKTSQAVANLRHTKFLKLFLNTDKTLEQSHAIVYGASKGKNKSAVVSDLVRRIIRDLEQSKLKTSIFSREQIETALATKGLTPQRLAEEIDKMLNALRKDDANYWSKRFGVELLSKIVGAFAPTKQEIVHITPATAKDIAVELFHQLDNFKYRHFIKQCISTYEQGGKPEDVIDADYTVEDEVQAQKTPTDTIQRGTKSP
jgi:hypothetical protein